MEEHPGIVFRDGPGGRRAALAAGPDVWELVRPVTVGPVVTALDALLSGDEPYPGFVHWL